MKGHNWGRCRTCGKLHKHRGTLGMKLPKKDLDINHIKELYFIKKLSLVKVGKKLNVTRTTIRMRLIKAKYQLRGRYEINPTSRGYKHTKKYKEIQSERIRLNNPMKKLRTNRTTFKKSSIPWNKGKRGLHKASKELREVRSQNAKRLWSNHEHIKKVMLALYSKPNKSEKLLNEIIKGITNDFKFNGDFSLGITIGRRIPDWVNINGKKEVIELFGEPFHKPNKYFKVDENRTKEKTIEHYNRFGYGCLVIWSKELRHPNKVRHKIQNFIGDRHSQISS